MRVGRAAIDEETIRQIEASHPEFEFDWPQILKGRDPESAPAEHPRRARERSEGPHGAPAPGRTRRELPETVRADEPPASGAAENIEEASAAQTPEPAEPASPAEARLGSAGLARLRARYAELVTRITDRVPDVERQDELKASAERLNPDAWITDADVTAGLDAYEQTYEMVRSSLPPRRKPGEPV